MLVNYPTEAYNSFVNVEDADDFFADRLNAEAWDAFEESRKEKLLIRGFRVITSYVNEDDVALVDLQFAQMEQALYEYRFSPDTYIDPVSSVTVDGLKADFAKNTVARLAPEAVLLLKPYRRLNTLEVRR
ncbi:hypothetical protein [Desulfolutivibrio sp.]|uniref:hypothetical protein n=1 Tax=Desulfolutivibrio sp. TaxID=2773296 RepID=UPI002F9613A9